MMSAMPRRSSTAIVQGTAPPCSAGIPPATVAARAAPGGTTQHATAAAACRSPIAVLAMPAMLLHTAAAATAAAAASMVPCMPLLSGGIQVMVALAAVVATQLRYARVAAAMR